MARKIRHNYDSDEGLEEAKIHSNWAVSYADMVTLLLCFFIMFFNVDKKEVTPAQKDQMLLSISNQFQKFTKKTSEVDTPAKNGPKSKETMPKTEVETAGSEFAVILSQLKILPNAKVIGTQENLELQIANVEFFARGSTKLTDRGMKNVDMVYSVIKPYREKVYVEIIGHSDSEPVASSAELKLKRKFSSNLELSTLRAMDVFSYIRGLGMIPENMVISGYSDSMPIDVEASGVSDSTSVQRRVSFRIRLKK